MIHFRETLLYCLLIIVLPYAVGAECTCDSDSEDQNNPRALKLKLMALASILIAGGTGICIPLLGKTIKSFQPEKSIFFFIKVFAAGVILSTGFIHILPDAIDNLTSPCLNESPWGKFPFTGLVAMTSAIVTLMVDVFATAYCTENTHQRINGDVENTSTHAAHRHTSDLSRHKVVSLVLELGILVHSVMIGISLGASKSPKTIKPLIAALTFHQFFEGMGLGASISKAQFNPRQVAVMVAFFSLTTPGGIAIGIGMSKIYNESSPTALIVEGISNAAAAGILIYMALVDLLAAEFKSPRFQNSGFHQLGASVSLLLGAGLMSLLAIWA